MGGCVLAVIEGNRQGATATNKVVCRDATTHVPGSPSSFPLPSPATHPHVRRVRSGRKGGGPSNTSASGGRARVPHRERRCGDMVALGARRRAAATETETETETETGRGQVGQGGGGGGGRKERVL